MKKLVQTITNQFPNLDYCGIVDRNDLNTYESVLQQTNDISGLEYWLEWIRTSKHDLNYSRIHVGSKAQLFIKKVDNDRKLLVINKSENTTLLISFLLDLDCTIETPPQTIINHTEVKVDPKLQEAVRIQKMIIPKEEDIRKHFKNFFVVHQQQDVVGGDFYWYTRKGNRVYLALVDCTGHSLEGAMTSMIANTILNQLTSIDTTNSPKVILSEFYEQLNIYNQQAAETEGNYGVGAEIGLFCLDYDEQLIKFSSTGIPAFIKYVDRIELLKPKKTMSFEHLSETLVDQSLNMTGIERIYSFTDGVSDQFDAEDRKKLGRKGVQRIIESEGEFNSNYYRSQLNSWKGNNMQYDDMTFMGLAI